MNVRDFVLNQLAKGSQTTEELSSILPLEKATRLGKTLARLEMQRKIVKTMVVAGKDVWALY